ncbi:MAG: hypothetical protein M3Z56_05660 [Bacteroidota bacterium]|nr:hypothetical protein [Bacteroidota bacterium]
MKLIVSLLLLMILLTSQCSSAKTRDSLLTKSKHQKTAAWILLGGGWGLGIAGLVTGLNGTVDLLSGQFDKAGKNVGAGGILLIAGGVAMLGSIPLFIAAHKNKHKATSLSFTNQLTPALVNSVTGRRCVPSVSLRFNL